VQKHLQRNPHLPKRLAAFPYSLQQIGSHKFRALCEVMRLRRVLLIAGSRLAELR
jgi:hypothetical protein